MEKWIEDIVKYEPKDRHEANERNQIMCVILALRDGIPIDMDSLRRVRDRVEALLEGRIHPDRVDMC